MRRLLIISALVSSILVGAALLWGNSVSAQAAAGLEEVGSVINLSATDPRVIAARIINIALGFLGMILLVLVLYAGFLWMTSGGEADKVSKAKKILVSAAIGAVIVLSSWAIARFVLERLMQATGGSGGTPSETRPPGPGLGGGGGAQAFQLKSISPQGAVPIRNVQVKFLFTRSVDDKTASAIQVTETGGQIVAGVLSVNGSLVTFVPAQGCPPPNEALKCFEGEKDFTVKVGEALRSTQNQAIVCGGFAPSCTVTFHTGNLIDVQAPNVSVIEPLNGQGVPADSLVLLRAQASDDSGVANVDFYDGEDMVDQSAPNENPTPKSFTADGYWDTAGIELQSIRQLSAKAFDIDTHEKQSATISAIIRPAACFNQVQDGEETGVDCGGTPNTPGFCGACPGGACVTNFDCSSGVCKDGMCVEQPVISDVSPLDGKAGTFVTLRGINLGKTGGVVFLGGGNVDDDKVASVPQICLQGGFNTWSSTQVIVAVPDGASSGPIQITNGDSQLSDRTNDTMGPVFPDFLVNDKVYPGLCGLNPAKGFVGEKFTAVGQGFGQNPSSMSFGKNVIKQFASWTDAQVAANVPVVNAGKNTVTVLAGEVASNPAAFEVLSKSKAGPPQIFSLDPTSGPKGEYLTLSGKNFGNTVGTVRFKNKVNQQEAVGDVSFPAACSQGFWNENNVIIKVPSAFLNQQGIVLGDYSVRLKRADNTESNEIDFSINANALKPGICAINPSAGPVGTEVTLIGERFGADTGSVTFSSNKAAVVGDWKSQEVKTKVPAGAETGAVVITAQAVKSNSAYFQVRNCNEQPDVCSPSEQCCGDGTCLDAKQICPSVSIKAVFAWQSSTGFIPVAPRVVEECAPNQNPVPAPSPSPWENRAGGNAVCVNATIIARFTTHLEPSSVTAANFKLKKCIDPGQNPCAKVAELALDGGFPLLQPASEDQDLVVLQAKNLLETKTTYLVEILTGVKGKGVTGANMDESAKCGKGVGYCFRFATRDSQEPCKVGGVSVAPNSYELQDSGLELDYLASPLAADDKCVVLQCKQYDWAWEHGDNNGDNRAIFKTPLTEGPDPGKTSCRQVGISISETGDVPVNMSATALPDKVKGTGQLYIRFVPPRVEAFEPKCQTACVNALVWARFNTELDPASIVDNVEIYPCTNENCVVTELEQPLAIPPNKITVVTVPKTAEETKRFLSIEPVTSLNQPLLLPGKYYRVLLRGGNEQGIRGLHGVPMTGLNDPEGFVWTFRTKLGQEGFCAAEAVAVAPVTKYETEVGARQLFQATAFGAPDDCNETGQALIQTESSKWGSSDKLVASLFSDGKIDTGAALAPRCSSMCLALGAQAEFGKVAVCGNGIIETTDAVYCKNNLTPYGDKCSVLPSGARAGEQCDPKILSNVGQCDVNTCLWKPISQLPVGTCGNGPPKPGEKLEQGEACDFGNVCLGADAESDTPDGTPCVEQAAKVKCETNKGVCAPRQFRGCSLFCRHTGAKSGNSTCGNGDVADGEDCDDGNTTSRDGCSSDCLHEGSSPSIASVCGNAILEPGETCEKLNVNDPVFPPGCNEKVCLHVGDTMCDKDPDTPNVNCCGNVIVEAGEDCDDGNNLVGDGCSAVCLLEGSSAGYVPDPSFCGNSLLEKGEQCEAGLPSSHKDLKNAPNNAAPVSPKGSLKGDGLADSAQLAYIVGDTDPGEKGLMSSNISAELLGKTGEAVYGLQCGFTAEDSCTKPGYGLTDKGCCNVRPEFESSYPSGAGVCRNVQISVKFKTDMKTDSLAANVRMAKSVGDIKCPPGTVLVAEDFTPLAPGIRSWLANLWQGLKTWLTGQPTLAQIWCAGSVTGSWVPASNKNTQEFIFKLDAALEPQTKYRVKFLGDPNLADNNEPARKLGIKSAQGVVALADPSPDTGSLTFSFTTGDQICNLNVIEVTDENSEHPLLFVSKDETPHAFKATAKSMQNGKPVPIVPVNGYQWEWQPWSTSKKDVVNVVLPAPQDKTQANIKPENKNGSAFVTAMTKVVADTINQPSTKDLSVHGTAPVTVMLCENPWLTTPFSDVNYNFSTLYCRDVGESGTGDDLPKLDIAFVPQTPIAKSEGILREFLFTYGKDYPELKKDGIGIRIVSNPIHYSPEEWYAWRGFTGSPKSIEIDGYRALQDGTTVYVSAANTEGAGQDIYSNIYLMSHNADASTTTLAIFNQLVENWTFNINLSQGVGNVCEEGNDPNTEPKNSYVDTNHPEPVACSTDFDCINALGTNETHCGSYKLKLSRDTIRVADFAKMSRALETAKARDGFYPKLTAGTFVPTYSNSRWPSWSKEFTAAVGGSVKMTVDPVNRFVTCGRCQDSNIVCGKNEDCPESKACQGFLVDKSSPSIDPLTCYDTDTRKFLCPTLGESPSRFYQYRSINNGQRYELMAEFEVPEPSVPGAKWWNPPLTKEVKRCVNPQTSGYLCEADLDCRACSNPKDSVACPENKYPIIPGACKIVGGKFVYQAICNNQSYGPSGTCGDDMIGQACDGGSNVKNPCAKDADCPGGTCTASEICELKQTQITTCKTDPNQPKDNGLKVQICNDCKEWVDDPNVSICNLGAMCGNGKIDLVCNAGGRKDLGCSADSQCPDGHCLPSNEKCDDGKLNGTYGHCNTQCSGYAGYCGDGMISPGEICDNDDKDPKYINGVYCGQGCEIGKSCGLDCKSKAPYCGDEEVTSPEECDGQTETTASAICIGGAVNKPCVTDADCGTAEEKAKCAAGVDLLKTCKDTVIKRCVTAMKQCVTQGYSSAAHKPGDFKVCKVNEDCKVEPGGKTSCRSVQEFVTSCTGDTECSLSSGITGSCVGFPTAHTRTCKANECKFDAWTACQAVGSCGDGIIQKPGEECDNGKDNGDTKACTSECKKNFCGDGKPLINVEECDNGVQNGKVTCNADYNASCNSCSLQCKFTASSGGFCGDKVKNGPEQCDGTKVAEKIPDQFPGGRYAQPPLSVLNSYLNADCMQSPCMITKEPNITCQSLGYDFSNNGAAPKLIPLNDKVDKLGEGVCFQGSKKYEVIALEECLKISCTTKLTKPLTSKYFYRYAGDPPPKDPKEVVAIYTFPEFLPTVEEFWKCVKEKGPAEGVGISTSKTPEIVTCNQSCAFSGCGRCSDEAGMGVIKSQIVDAVYNQVVPFARVSLFYKGVLITQVASDKDGKFILTNLNDRAECSQYKLVIDKYEDNPCTGNVSRPTCGGASYPKWTVQTEVDEGKRGGYWPLTTPFFTVSNFVEKVSQQKDGRIFLFPRPGAGEAYYSVFWKIPWKTSGMDAIWGGNANHLILPTGYTVANYKDKTVCNDDPNEHCVENKDCQDNGDCNTVKGSVGYLTCKAGDKIGSKCGVNKDCLSEARCNMTDPNFPENYSPNQCNYADGPTNDKHHCARDITWSDALRGRSKIEQFPYAQNICLHNAGDKVGGYGPPYNFYNGCPVEGRKACEDRLGKDWDPECQKGIESEQFSIFECIKDDGTSTGQTCLNNNDCATGRCWELCGKTFWDTCDFYSSGPLTTYFRYAPYGGQNTPISMLWNYWKKSIYPDFNSKASLLAKHLKYDELQGGQGGGILTVGQDYSAAISTSKQLFEIKAEDIMKFLCDNEKDCKYWHIADLNPKDGTVALINILRDERVGETGAVAAYEPSFQGVYWSDVNPIPNGDGINDIQYCVKDKILYEVCKWDEVQKKYVPYPNCDKIKGSCQNVGYKPWSQANY